jgi:hypothetical protein
MGVRTFAHEVDAANKSKAAEQGSDGNGNFDASGEDAGTKKSEELNADLE